MKSPEQTKDAIDEQGFFHSGDVGSFDEDGFLRITGRLKDLIITSGGENVPAGLIEKEMKAAMPCLSYVVVVGDKRKYLTMILTLKVMMDKDTGTPTDYLTEESLHTSNQIGSTSKSVTEVLRDPLWKLYIDEGMSRANQKAASHLQHVKMWRLLAVDLSESTGEITPTLKLKRNFTVDKYQSVIDSMYKEYSEEKKSEF
jgi:long-chain-fatty-acid--CoA ligase ACSBG